MIAEGNGNGYGAFGPGVGTGCGLGPALRRLATLPSRSNQKVEPSSSAAIVRAKPSSFIGIWSPGGGNSRAGLTFCGEVPSGGGVLLLTQPSGRPRSTALRIACWASDTLLVFPQRWPPQPRASHSGTSSAPG